MSLYNQFLFLMMSNAPILEGEPRMLLDCHRSTAYSKLYLISARLSFGVGIAFDVFFHTIEERLDSISTAQWHSSPSHEASIGDRNTERLAYAW